MSPYSVGRVTIDIYSNGLAQTLAWNPLTGEQLSPEEQTKLLESASQALANLVFCANDHAFKQERVRRFHQLLSREVS